MHQKQATTPTNTDTLDKMIRQPNLKNKPTCHPFSQMQRNTKNHKIKHETDIQKTHSNVIALPLVANTEHLDDDKTLKMNTAEIHNATHNTTHTWTVT